MLEVKCEREGRKPFHYADLIILNKDTALIRPQKPSDNKMEVKFPRLRSCYYPFLKGHERGQSTVEFILMMFVFMVVMASFMSTTFFAAQGLLTRYVAYAGARGYMAYSNTSYGGKWMEGVTAIEKIVPNHIGPAIVRQSGDGVVVDMMIQELFPALRTIGQTGTVDIHVKVSLGMEPPLSGDNTL